MDFKGLIFVSGKGGTGKTTFAIALSHHLARQGKRVLLVELASRSSVASLLNLHSLTLGYQPTRTHFGFDLSLLRGVDCLVDYIGSVMGVERIAKKIFETSIIRSLVNVAPGLNDLALLGKLTSHLREHGPSFDYDHIVVDAPSTGSFYSLLNAPRILGNSVSRGPLRSQSETIENVLKDANSVQYFVMSLFEEFSSDELEDTIGLLNDSIGDQLNVVANKYFEITESQSQDDWWLKFLNFQQSKIQSQSERVRDLWIKSYLFDLMTEPLSESLRAYQGDLLRKL